MTIKIIIIALIICSLFLISCTLTANQPAKKNQAPGLHEGQLLRCPDKPNCINTEFPDDSSHYFPPLDFSAAEKDKIMPLAITIIQKMGGTVVAKGNVTQGSVAKGSTQESASENNHYLAVTFTSSLFRFVDDFELRQDNISHKLHIRSASRTGYSDFGVNKRRVKQFSEHFKKP